MADAKTNEVLTVNLKLNSPHQKAPDKNHHWQDLRVGRFTGFCKESYMDELLSANMLGFRDYLRIDGVRDDDAFTGANDRVYLTDQLATVIANLHATSRLQATDEGPRSG